MSTSNCLQKTGKASSLSYRRRYFSAMPGPEQSTTSNRQAGDPEYTAKFYEAQGWYEGPGGKWTMAAERPSPGFRAAPHTTGSSSSWETMSPQTPTEGEDHSNDNGGGTRRLADAHRRSAEVSNVRTDPSVKVCRIIFVFWYSIIYTDFTSYST